MKKYMDKLKSNVRINKNLFVFLVVIIAVGVAAGSIFVTLLNDTDKVMVSDYLNNFLNNLNANNLNYNGTLINTIIFTLGAALLIWLLGISVIGFLLILLFLFIKAFSLGFSIASIIINFNFKGILISLAYVIPHHVINLMIYILLSSSKLTKFKGFGPGVSRPGAWFRPQRPCQQTSQNAGKGVHYAARRTAMPKARPALP